jgi:hypothetical protein
VAINAVAMVLVVKKTNACVKTVTWGSIVPAKFVSLVTRGVGYPSPTIYGPMPNAAMPVSATVKLGSVIATRVLLVGPAVVSLVPINVRATVPAKKLAI